MIAGSSVVLLCLLSALAGSLGGYALGRLVRSLQAASKPALRRCTVPLQNRDTQEITWHGAVVTEETDTHYHVRYDAAYYNNNREDLAWVKKDRVRFVATPVDVQAERTEVPKAFYD